MKPTMTIASAAAAASAICRASTEVQPSGLSAKTFLPAAMASTRLLAKRW